MDGHFGVLIKTLNRLENKLPINNIMELQKFMSQEEALRQTVQKRIMDEQTIESPLKKSLNKVYFLLYARPLDQDEIQDQPDNVTQENQSDEETQEIIGSQNNSDIHQSFC